MSTTILITGGNGQLGADCRRVLQKKYRVHCLASGELDITDQQRVAACLAEIAPEVILNCAAYTRVDGCESDRETCLRVNGEGPRILAEAAEKAGARLLHISTDYVFDGSKDVPHPYDEEDRVNPLSLYGESKLRGEEAVREILDNHLIIRTAWLYGMGGANFLKTMLRLAVSDPRRTIRVVDDQYGSLTWTFELARQIKRLIDADITGTVHATADGYTTWYRGAAFFLEAMGIPHSLEPCTTEQYPTPTHRPANSILRNQRLRQAGLDIMRSWQEQVDDFVHRHRRELLTEAGYHPET